MGTSDNPEADRSPVEDDELLPHAGNLATSLQGMTYDFARAIADVVDNSVAAGAHNVLTNGLRSSSMSEYDVR